MYPSRNDQPLYVAGGSGEKIAEAKAKHNQYLSELGLPPI